MEKALYLVLVLALNNSRGLCDSSSSGAIWNSSCVRSN